MFATLSRLLLVLACLLPFSNTALAVDASPSAALTATVDTYAKAWLETDPAARKRMLKQVWAKDGRYQDPTVAVVGVDALSAHIGQVLAQYPKIRMTAVGKVDGFRSAFRYSWVVDLGNGAPPIEGQDVGSLDKAGRINAITGFFGAAGNAAQGQNEAVVAAYLDGLFTRFDIPTLEKLIAKDAVYNQAKGLPFGGTYVGFPSWLEMFQKAQSVVAVRPVDQPVLFTDPASGRVIATFSIRFASKKGSWQVVMPIAEWFDVKDGKITAITPYYHDTKTLSDLIASDGAPK